MMDTLEQVYDKIKNQQMDYHIMLKDFINGKEIDLNKMFELQSSIVRMIIYSRERNLSETKNVLLGAITPKLEKMLEEHDKGLIT